jgi:hypothetical protein
MMRQAKQSATRKNVEKYILTGNHEATWYNNIKIKNKVRSETGREGPDGQ